MEHKKHVLGLIDEIEVILSSNFKDKTLRNQYAWWILQAITGKDQAILIGLAEIDLAQTEQKKLKEWLDKIVLEHMPLQYLLGSVPFLDIEIIVEPPVLIPRPETEEWTAWLINSLKKVKETKLCILDLCCGTGCIGLALAKAFPQAKVYAADISEQALALAKKNAAHNKITNIDFIHSDLYTELDTTTAFDLIVSNPPYISFDEFQDMDASVTTWEDPQALVADDQGTAIIEDIILDAGDYLKTNQELALLQIPQLVLEIGYKQAKRVSDLLQSNGFSDIHVHQDMEGKDRWVTARLKNE